MGTFDLFLLVMAIVAIGVMICLFFVDAGYGKFYNHRWGPAIGNRLGWVLMEAPVFVVMLVLWLCCDRRADVARLAMLCIFEIHYLQRSFIFPFLIRGHGKMPLSIILMGALFNTLNAFMQGGWLFYVSSPERYASSWLVDPHFIIGTLVFCWGFYINLRSDYIIRHLRKPGDNAHYLPTGGMFHYVTSANYFGEFIEWVGYAILTWSWAGAVFALWTFANLAPRASRIHDRYAKEFAGQFNPNKVKRIIPFIW